MQNRIICLIGFILISYTTLFSQEVVFLESTTLTKKELVTGLTIPWEILWGADDHIWATQRNGVIVRVDPNTGNYTEVLDWRFKVINEDDDGFGSEYGMLGMAMHPDFENEPKVFVVYNYAIPGTFDIMERLVSFDWDGDKLSNETFILDEITGGGYHNGSRLLISKDHKILMTMGDAGLLTRPQDTTEYNGKILRINLDGSIPIDNPFEDSYTYSFGHRNCQGMVYGPNDELFVSEHGNMIADEINKITPRGNYGWPNVEGECNTNFEIDFCEANNVIEPLYDWTPCVGVCGLEYYDHEAIPEWKGKFLLAVLGGAGFTKAPRISVLSPNEDASEIVEEQLFFENYGRLRDLCINPHTGSIYFATNGPSYPGSGPNSIIEFANLDYISSVSNPGFNSQNIQILPNPAQDFIEVASNENLNGTAYHIISYQGKVVKSGVLESDKTRISVNEMVPGNYFLRATNDKGIITRTFVLIK